MPRRWPLRASAVALLVAAPWLLAPSARAQMRELDAHVVWSRDAHIYVAAPDSGVLAPGMLLSVRRGERELARGRVTRLYEPRLAVMDIESGSLTGETRLEQLRVRGESTLDLRLTRVRVGLPARERRNLLFGCDAPSVAPTFANEHFQLDTLAAGALRMRRRIESPGLPVAPDTLEVTFFRDATDAEIALERGDLDVAVFWPGELSARMRNGERAAHVFPGRRARGVLAYVRSDADSVPLPPSDLATLNRIAFAGDLLLCVPADPPAGAATVPWAAARYRVDPAIPGARVLERALQRVSRAAATRTVQLRWYDVSLEAASAPGATTAGTDALPRSATPALAMQCVVVSSARAHTLVAALGASAFADLVVCGGGPR